MPLFLHSDKEKLGLGNRRVRNEKNYEDKRTGQNKSHSEKKNILLHLKSSAFSLHVIKL